VPVFICANKAIADMLNSADPKLHDAWMQDRSSAQRLTYNTDRDREPTTESENMDLHELRAREKVALGAKSISDVAVDLIYTAEMDDEPAHRRVSDIVRAFQTYGSIAHMQQVYRRDHQTAELADIVSSVAYCADVEEFVARIFLEATGRPVA
jgi:hypothetical protein